MRIEIARMDDRMAPSGKAILRSLQNESMPVVDLVVRESFQNSLDATKNGEKETKISVNTNRIDTKNISSYFEKIENRLEEKFPGEHTVLSISDKNTYGLTGAIHTTSKKALSESNIYKLIYGLNMNQEKDGAGGSWGLGKTSFFRIGCGIVIYYSRIKNENNIYEERLAACLVENSDDPDAVMRDNDRGIAWWGSKEPGTDNYDKSYPITDSDIIHEFLSKLKAVPYEGTETGTTIIIPFITEEKVVATEQEFSEGNAYWWEGELSASIEMAIKRWYGPRIMNKEYNNRFGNSVLIPSVNGKIISPLTFEDTFDWFYKLFSAGIVGNSFESEITVKPVYLKRLGMNDTNEPVGNLSYMKINMNEIRAGGKSSALTPLAYIGSKNHLENASAGSKILAYSRMPGMVVQYVVDDADWMKGLTVEENTFVLAYFVPNSEGILHSKYHERYKTLENYLRDTENADHAMWIDKVIGAKPITIIERTKREVSKALYEGLTDTDPTSSNSRTSALSRKFGGILLPKANFGKSSNRKTEDTPKTKKHSKGSSSMIQISEVELLDDKNMKIQYEANVTQNSKVFFEVDTVDKKIDEEKWNKYFENKVKYPFKVKETKIEKVDGKEYAEYLPENEIEVINLPDTVSGFDIKTSSNKRHTIFGSISVEISDSTMQPSLSIKKL